MKNRGEKPKSRAPGRTPTLLALARFGALFVWMAESVVVMNDALDAGTNYAVWKWAVAWSVMTALGAAWTAAVHMGANPSWIEAHMFTATHALCLILLAAADLRVTRTADGALAAFMCTSAVAVIPPMIYGARMAWE